MVVNLARSGLDAGFRQLLSDRVCLSQVFFTAAQSFSLLTVRRIISLSSQTTLLF